MKPKCIANCDAILVKLCPVQYVELYSLLVLPAVEHDVAIMMKKMTNKDVRASILPSSTQFTGRATDHFLSVGYCSSVYLNMSKTVGQNPSNCGRQLPWHVQMCHCSEVKTSCFKTCHLRISTDNSIRTLFHTTLKCIQGCHL